MSTVHAMSQRLHHVLLAMGHGATIEDAERVLAAVGLDKDRVPHVLVGVYELSQMMGVSPSLACKIVRRYPDFPPPVAELRCGRIWDLHDLDRWVKETQ